MAKLEYAASFRDLIVYRKAWALSLEIFRLTKRFPKEETYSLTDQIRRSSRSVGAQIAEAWAKQRCSSASRHLTKLKRNKQNTLRFLR